MVKSAAAEKLNLVRPMPLFEGPRLLVTREKHGTYYYLITDEAQLHATALALVKERVGLGYYYGDEDSVKEALKDQEEQREKYQKLKAEVDSLTNDVLRKAGERELESLKNDFKYNAEVLRHYKMAERALRDSNGLLAWTLLSERSSYEYECVQLETMGIETNRCPQPAKPFHGQAWVDADGNRWVYDGRLLKKWIPRIYAQMLYNVQAYQGVSPIVRMRDEANEYDKQPKGGDSDAEQE